MSAATLRETSRPTLAPAPLRRHVATAPRGPVVDDLSHVRRELAIELVLEAELAESMGADADLVEALREKARRVLRGTTPSLAPAPLAMRQAEDDVQVIITV